MSGLGGIYNRNGAPVEAELLRALGKTLSRLGPDGGREISAGQIGMSYRAFHTNKESGSEVQPTQSSDKHILAWDGRLDNRDELLVLLRDELHGGGETDSEIVLAAFLKWGTNALSRLVGDFALSLWDPKSQLLMLARDPFGTRPLYYQIKERVVFWSSNIRSLLDLSGVSIEINEEYVAGFLGRFPGLSETPYRGIDSVKPGNVVAIKSDTVRAWRFWGPDPSREIRYRTDKDYEEHFRQLFREAVRVRLRSDRPVWCELSGGLDSSSIVCVADEIIQSGEAQVPALQTVSYLNGQCASDLDNQYVGYVEERRGRRGLHLPEYEYWMRFSSPQKDFVAFPSNLLCVADRHDRLRLEMRRNRARVLLSGLGGDQLLWSSLNPSPELTDLLSEFNLLTLHRRLLLWSQILKKPYLQLLWRNSLLPLLPAVIRMWVQPSMRTCLWLDKNFVSRMNQRKRLLLPPDPYGFDRWSSRMQSSLVLFVISAVSAGNYRQGEDIELTYPFLHRPLVEYLMAIPHEQKLRPGESRSLMRRALRDVLPPEILARKNKGAIDETIFRAFAREWPRLKPMFADARVCSRGYMNPGALDHALNQVRNGGQVLGGDLLRTVSLEVWLRSLEHQYALA
jgi:asparagine synthase (glutamine-hydrolysing)